MEYLILDYKNTPSSERENTVLDKVIKKYRLFEHFPLFKQYKKYKQYRQLMPCWKSRVYENIEFVNITIPMSLKELSQLTPEKVQKRIWEVIASNAISQQNVRFFAVLPELGNYIPPQLKWCEDTDELYIILIQGFLSELCRDCNEGKVQEDISVRNHYVPKGTACLWFLDDGTRDIASYIRQLSKDWNYVTVCSNRHWQLDPLYQKLYEEEGLMIQCMDWEKSKQTRQDTGAMPSEEGLHGQANIVIDLTSDWKGIHHIYPKNSYVFDTTFSKEKQGYLRAKQVKLADYIQGAQFINM